MTCIVGIIEDGAVHLGGDSAAMSGYDLSLLADGKLATVGEFIIGVTGSVRLIQLVRHRFTPPAIPAGADLPGYMATAFVDALRECFKDAGFARKDNDREHAGNSALLVGVRGRLFVIYGDYGITETADGYAAVGCGDQLATGALYATARTGGAAPWRLHLALCAAEAANIGVRAPFTYASLPAFAKQTEQSHGAA